MKTLFVLAMILTALSAKADGFKCEGVNTGITIKVFNHTDPTEGTRSPAIMVVADSYVHNPNQTIVSFTSDNNTLAYLGHGRFSGKVDLRYIESRRKGENIAGTKLGYLSHINLEIPGFVYSGSNHKNGEILDAKISYVKRDGEILDEKAVCQRYLKN